MENKEFAKQLEDRTKRFAISVIKLSALLPGSPEGKVVRNQFTKPVLTEAIELLAIFTSTGKTLKL